MCLGFCQTHTGFVVKAEVVGWGRVRLSPQPPGKQDQDLSRHWTLAGVDSEVWGLTRGWN